MTTDADGIPVRVKFWARTASLMGLVPGFLAISSLMAEWLGEGWALAAASLLLLLVVPYAVFRYLLRFHRRPWLSAAVLLGLFHWGLVMVAILASTSATLLAIKHHGSWMVGLALKEHEPRIRKGLAAMVDNVPTTPQEIPFTIHSGAMVTEVTFEHHGRRVAAPLVLDTGASLTAVSPDVLEALGIMVPARAPAYTFETANGEATYPLVLLESVFLGSERVGPVVVAVCQECATSHSLGLLGLNVTSRFTISINEREGFIIARKKEGWVDTTFELEPFLELVPSLKGSTLQASLINRAPARMKDVVISLEFLDKNGRALDERRISVDTLGPGESHPLSVRFLPQGTDGIRWTVQRGEWGEIAQIKRDFSRL